MPNLQPTRIYFYLPLVELINSVRESPKILGSTPLPGNVYFVALDEHVKAVMLAW